MKTAVAAEMRKRDDTWLSRLESYTEVHDELKRQFKDQRCVLIRVDYCLQQEVAFNARGSSGTVTAMPGLSSSLSIS